MFENPENVQDEQTLLVELEGARSRLDDLSRELRVVDETLEERSAERAQYALVQQVCGTLEKLSDLGGAELFWGDLLSGGNPDFHIGMVRRQVDEFERCIGEIDRSRQSLLERIGRERQATGYLEDDLDDLKQREEMKKLEWVVEREMGPVSTASPVMPWARGGEDDKRFRKSLGISMLLALLIALLMPLVDLPVPESWQATDVQERFTSLIKEDLQPPPPVVPEQTLEKLAEKVTETVTETADAPPTSDAQRDLEPGAEPAPRQSAGSKGILAFREKFSSVATSEPASKLGARARIDRAGEAATGQGGRSMVTTQTPGSSGGINIASISRGDVGGGGGGAIEGVGVGKATSSIGGIGGGTGLGGPGGDGRSLSGGGPGLGRTDEEIQIVFDRHKSALYRLYNKELRRDPTLRGQMVLRMTIEADGSVSLCAVQSSDMNAPELSTQIVERVKGFDFGAKDGISAITILYPIDFLPAT